MEMPDLRQGSLIGVQEVQSSNLGSPTNPLRPKFPDFITLPQTFAPTSTTGRAQLRIIRPICRLVCQLLCGSVRLPTLLSKNQRKGPTHIAVGDRKSTRLNSSHLG